MPDLDVHETVKTVTDGPLVVVKRYSPSSDLWGAVPPGRHTGSHRDESSATTLPADEVLEYFRYRPPSSFEASGHIRLNKIVFLFPLRIIDHAVAS